MHWNLYNYTLSLNDNLKITNDVHFAKRYGCIVWLNINAIKASLVNSTILNTNYRPLFDMLVDCLITSNGKCYPGEVKIGTDGKLTAFLYIPDSSGLVVASPDYVVYSNAFWLIG